MGCDGGTIPRRDEMVKLKKKAEKADRDVELAAKWRHCAISGEELTLPVVACQLGRLYNKESLLMALLDKSNMPDVASHIHSLKDVVELQLTPNPGYTPSDKGDTYNDVHAAKYVCPVSGLEMSGWYRFMFLRTCGCVFSEKALKEVPSENCHKCGQPFRQEDVVIINGTEEDVRALREAMDERKRQARLTKRKRKAESSPEECSSSAEPSTSGSPPAEKKKRISPSNAQEKTSKPASAGYKKRPVSKVGAKASGSKVVGASKLNARSTASAVTQKATEAVSSYKTVAEDPSARQAYKSLFNSSAQERPKERTAHWVTFFPYH